MSFFRRFKKDKTDKTTGADAISPSSALACKQVAEDLQSFLDNEDTVANRDLIAAHLEACRDCGLEANTFNQLKASLARPVLEIDDTALDRLRAFGASISEEADGGQLADDSAN